MTQDDDEDLDDAEMDPAAEAAWREAIAAYEALEPPARAAEIVRRLERLRDRVGTGIETRSIADEDDAFDTVHWRARCADGRAFTFRVDVERSTCVIDVPIRNQLGLFLLRRDFEEVPAGCIQLGPAARAVHVAPVGEAFEGILARMSPRLVEDVARWMDEGSVFELAAAEDRLRLELLGFLHEQPEVDFSESLALVLAPAGVPQLAAFFEAGGDIACAFCSSRFIPTPTRTCPHCGAPMSAG